MSIKNIIFALGFTVYAFTSINAMKEEKIDERKHKIKLTYKNKLLSWGQATAFLEAKVLRNMIDVDENSYYGEEIAIDEIIDNKDQDEFFKNNILDILNIVPSHVLRTIFQNEHKFEYLLLASSEKELEHVSKNLKNITNSLEKIKKDAEESAHDEISKIVKNDKKKMMDMIRCAYYINSSVQDDLIEFALNNNLIEKEILESTDFTAESLQAIREDCVSDEILPLETIIEQRNLRVSEKESIINKIKAVYYKKKSKEEQRWLNMQKDTLLDLKAKAILTRNARLNLVFSDPELTLLNFSNVSLLYKIKLVKSVNEALKKITDDIESKKRKIERDIEAKKIECLKTFATTIPMPLIELALTLLIKKSLSFAKPPIRNDQAYWLQKTLVGVFLMPFSFSSKRTPPFYYMLSPLYQLVALYDFIKSYRANVHNYDGRYIIHVRSTLFMDDFAEIEADQVKKLIIEKKRLEHIKKTLEDIIKNEYVLKTSKK